LQAFGRAHPRRCRQRGCEKFDPEEVEGREFAQRHLREDRPCCRRGRGDDGQRERGRAGHRGIRNGHSDQGQRVWRRSGRRQREHRLSCGSDPEEGGAEVRVVQGRLEPDDVAVEGDGAVEVAHGQVRLEEPFDGDRFAHGAIE
jgi:hypothetical protein